VAKKASKLVQSFVQENGLLCSPIQHWLLLLTALHTAANAVQCPGGPWLLLVHMRKGMQLGWNENMQSLGVLRVLMVGSSVLLALLYLLTHLARRPDTYSKQEI
jgi:hypothetical protein